MARNKIDAICSTQPTGNLVKKMYAHSIHQQQTIAVSIKSCMVNLTFLKQETTSVIEHFKI